MPIVSKEADLTQPRPFPCLALDHVYFLGETFIWCLYHLWSWLPGIESFGVDWGARGRQLLPLPLPLPGLNELRAPVASHSGAVCYLENSRAAPARGRKNACRHAWVYLSPRVTVCRPNKAAPTMPGDAMQDCTAEDGKAVRASRSTGNTPISMHPRGEYSKFTKAHRRVYGHRCTLNSNRELSDYDITHIQTYLPPQVNKYR